MNVLEQLRAQMQAIVHETLSEMLDHSGKLSDLVRPDWKKLRYFFEAGKLGLEAVFRDDSTIFVYWDQAARDYIIELTPAQLPPRASIQLGRIPRGNA